MSSRVKPKKKITISPTTGQLDLVTDNNFSYESVPVGKKLKIYENMQMVVFGDFDSEGELTLEGSLVMED
jgi:hypothetical protein